MRCRFICVHLRPSAVPKEQAVAATNRATITEEEAAEAKRTVEQLAERSRPLGVNPDQLD